MKKKIHSIIKNRLIHFHQLFKNEGFFTLKNHNSNSSSIDKLSSIQEVDDNKLNEYKQSLKIE